MVDRWQAAWRMSRPLLNTVGKLGFRMKVIGGDQLPAGATIIAPNHHSFLDPPLIGMGLRRPIRFLATHDLWGKHRVLDALINLFGAVPLRNEGRPVRALRTALEHLKSGGTVGIFPEGRRVEDFGTEVARRGAAWLSVKSSAPLVPIYIHGSERSLSHRHPPFRFIPVALLVGTPLHPAEFGEGRTAVAGLTDAWEVSLRDLRAHA